MQKIPLGLFLLALLQVISCSKTIHPTAEVTYLSAANGVMNVRSVGYCQLSDSKENCTEAAEENAFKILFYRGIPGSQQSTPLITVDERSKEANSKFSKDFFESKRYKTFITSINPVSDMARQKNQKKIIVDVGINLAALRKELEQNKEIRKFGY